MHCTWDNYVYLILDLYVVIIITVPIKTLNIPRIYISGGGATIPESIYEAWKPAYEAYRRDYAEVILSYQARGSGEGIQRFSDNQYDYAGSDAALSEATYGNNTPAADYQMFPSMAGPVSVVYNIPETPEECFSQLPIINNPSCLNLTQEALVGIFNGTIRNWNDSLLVENNKILENISESIVVVVRADSSGTTSIFTSALSAFDTNWKAEYGESFTVGCDKKRKPLKWNKALLPLCGEKSRGVSGVVLNTPYSIAFMGASDAKDSLLTEARILNQAGNWISPSVEGTQAAMDATAKTLGTRMTGPIVNAPSAEAYPIAGYSYLLIRKISMRNCTIATEMYRYITFILEDPTAQKMVIDLRCAPISKIVSEQIRRHVLLEMICKGNRVSVDAAIDIATETAERLSAQRFPLHVAQEAWKTPVAIVVALVGVVLIMSTVLMWYIRYTKNKSVLTNSYILHLDLLHQRGKSSNSIRTTETGPLTNDFGTNAQVVRLAAEGEMLLLHTLCSHLVAETLLWKTRVLLVHFQERMNHSNLVKVMGISYLNDQWKTVTNCPTKGRLKDILHAETFQLDTVFRYAIATDIIDGMMYLHKQHFLHGQLTSSVCLVSARWNCVISDWDQHALHVAQKVPFIAFEQEHLAASDKNKEARQRDEYLRLLFFTDPETWQTDSRAEHMLVSTPTNKYTDIYSFGMVLYEIFTNIVPYEPSSASEDDNKSEDTNLAEILKQIKSERIRPMLSLQIIQTYPKIVDMLRSAWMQDPNVRPTFAELRSEMKQINPYRMNIVDTMMMAVESYARGLEHMVKERTVELERITKSMETLLHNMMPAAIADKLARGQVVEPEFYDSVTLCFTDIVGFTTIASNSAPLEIVALLNDLYSSFDSAISYHDVYKVETIGDSYMCISGLPHRNGEVHASEIASLVLDLLYAVTTIPIRHMPNEQLRIRAGAHSGPVMAGVVGIKMPRYCLFGDTVNTASRMESSSLPMRVQISEATKILLDHFQVYETRLRGVRSVKGKGTMTTFWLIGKTGYKNPLPIFTEQDDVELVKLLDETQLK